MIQKIGFQKEHKVPIQDRDFNSSEDNMIRLLTSKQNKIDWFVS